MPRWIANFPWSDRPLPFTALLAAAACISIAGFVALVFLAPFPHPYQTHLTPDALFSATIPPNTSPESVLPDLSPLAPDAVSPFQAFFQEHQAISQALRSDGPSAIIILPASASGSPRFILHGPSDRTNDVINALATEYPSTRPYPLPDGTIAREQFFDFPATNNNEIDFESGVLHTIHFSPPLAFSQFDDFFFSTSENLYQPVIAPSACINGITTTLPHTLIPPFFLWKLHISIIPTSFPLLLPDKKQIFMDGRAVWIDKLCISK